MPPPGATTPCRRARPVPSPLETSVASPFPAPALTRRPAPLPGPMMLQRRRCPSCPPPSAPGLASPSTRTTLCGGIGAADPAGAMAVSTSPKADAAGQTEASSTATAATALTVARTAAPSPRLQPISGPASASPSPYALLGGRSPPPSPRLSIWRHTPGVPSLHLERPPARGSCTAWYLPPTSSGPSHTRGQPITSIIGYQLSGFGTHRPSLLGQARSEVRSGSQPVLRIGPSS